MRSYLQINYDALVKSPAANEYLKSSWNHLISNLSDVIIGIFNKKIDSFFKSLKDLFMASQKKSEYISMRDAENETENLGFDKIQDEKEDSFQILDKAQVKIKELNGLIEKIPLVRSFQFQFKNNEVLGLKSLLIIIDLAKSMISLRLGGLDDSKSEMIAEVLRNLLQKPDFEMVFTYFPLIPSLLENLLILNNKMTKNPLLTKKMTDETLRIKGLIDDLLNNVQNGDMVETIRALKKQAGERKIEMELNWNESLFFTMINSKFYLSDEIEGKFREEDFFKETYVVNNRNIAKKILNSKMFFYLMNESILKTVIWKVLSREKDLNAKRNIIDFPFYCDFTCEYNEKKFVLMIKDHHKMVLGVENIMVPYFIELKDFWQQKGFIVKWISYEDYVIESHRQIFHLKHILMQD